MIKLTLLLILSLFSSQVYSTNSDRELDGYIKEFSIKALPYPGNKNKDLFKLGLTLFFETALSGNNNISCHDCHSAKSHTSDWLPLGLGEGAVGIADFRNQGQGLILPRHTPQLFNLGFNDIPHLFWDGRVEFDQRGGWRTPEPLLNGPNPQLKEIADTLDSLLAVQALFPISSPAEMAGKDSVHDNLTTWNNALERLFKSRFAKKYREMFEAAYPGVEKFNIGHVANALAEFQRYQFLAINTPWDLYLRGRKDLMSERMKRGAVLFYSKGQCVNCHSGSHMTSFAFQNVMIPQVGPGVKNTDDLGRFETTLNPQEIYQFRVTPLRNSALTPPYMHNGYLKTMWEVINHYDHPMRSLMHSIWDPWGDSRYSEPLMLDLDRGRIMQRARSAAPTELLPRFIQFSEAEKTDLYCFLMVGLTDLSLQDYLNAELMDPISDCNPLIGYRGY